MAHALEVTEIASRSASFLLVSKTTTTTTAIVPTERHRLASRAGANLARSTDHGTQLNAFPEPLPAHPLDAHPDHVPHWVPDGHCESLVHQQGTPAALH